MLEDQVNYCPRCGDKLILANRVGRERPACPSCDWVLFPDPKVAVIIVVIRDGKVLLTQRGNTPQRGLWTFPGGFVDAGEDPAQAAERECYEETGLKVKATTLIDVIFGQEHPRGAHIIIAYYGEILAGSVIPRDDAEDADFFYMNELPPLAFHSTQEIIRRIS